MTEAREKLARYRWEEHYRSQEHQSFEDDLPYVREKCYGHADEIISMMESLGYRLVPELKVLSDEEILEAYRKGKNTSAFLGVTLAETEGKKEIAQAQRDYDTRQLLKGE